MKKDSNIIKRKNKSGKFTYQVQIKYKDRYGVTQRYTKTLKTLKEAKLHVLEMKYKLSADYQLDKNNNKTFREMFDEFLELDSDSYSHNTLYNTTKYKDMLVNDIGDIHINKFDYVFFKKYFLELGNTKSYHTSQNIYKALNRVFEYAIKANYIKDNPLNRVTVSGEKTKRKKEGDLEVVTREQFDSIIEFVKKSRANKAYIPALYIAYMTGLRPSEIVALEFSDIDFVNDTLSVEKKAEYKGLTKENQKISDELKTEASRAVLPIHEELKNVLLEWKKTNPYNYIVVTADGKPVNPDVIGNYMRTIADKLNMPGLTLYTLRHTFITNLSYSDTDTKTFQSLCRHNNLETSYKYYVHSDLEKQRNAIANLFNK